VFRQYDRVALPVTDSDGVLIGIVTVDDVLDVAEEEATEDIHKIGGSEALDEPYLATPFWELIGKRARWLVVLFLGEMLTASAMVRYEVDLANAIVLAIFLPLIISSGGNSGSQAATFVIRALALREVGLRHWRRVLWRELRSGFALGSILAAIGAVRVAFGHFAFDAYGEHWPALAATIALALLGVVLRGTLSGAMLPFVMKRVGVDPAASSAPFVATLVDVIGIIIYFSAAEVFLRGRLL
jgi:magnesium transporter